MQKRSDTSMYQQTCDHADDKGDNPKRLKTWSEWLQLFFLKLRIRRRYYLLLSLAILVVVSILISEIFFDNVIYISVIWLHRMENFIQDMPWDTIPLFSGYHTFTLQDKIDVQAVVRRGQHSFCTVHEEVPLLVYMHVPKTAGTTMTDLLRDLRYQNRFLLTVSSRLHRSSQAEIDAREKDLTTYLTSFHHKTAESAHVRFLDFHKHGHPDPLYVGTFRNPIERMQSHYNYDAFANRPLYVDFKLWVKGQRGEAKPTLAQCVRKFIGRNITPADIPFGTDGEVTDPRVRAALKRIPKKFSCLKMKYINVQVKYYCGYHRHCKTLASHREMTQIAINNLPRFQVIMLTDRMHASVHLLDKMMPNFFRGSTHVYENREKAMSDKSKAREARHSREIRPEPYTCSYEPEEVNAAGGTRKITALHRRYCACNGTVYYGRKYEDDAPEMGDGDSRRPLSLADLKVTSDFISADASRTGGMHCTHKLSAIKGGFPSDPAPKVPKQCLCEPLPPHDRHGMNFIELFHMRSNVNTVTSSRVDLIPDDVLAYLGGFLRDEMELYAEVLKHFQNNMDRCGLR